MGTQHAGPAYEKYNGMLWFLIQDHTEDDPTWMIIRKFRTYCDGQSSLIELINNYKGDDLKKKWHNNAYIMNEKGNYDREIPQNTFKIFSNKKIKQYQGAHH